MSQPPSVQFPKRLAIATYHISHLRILLKSLRGANPFYTRALDQVESSHKLHHLGDFTGTFPFTTKEQLIADQLAHPPFGTNLTWPLDHYTRCHQTSGSTGAPLRWLDTPESWDRMLHSWEKVYRVAGVTRADRIFFAFSFGPFLGFWTAFESAVKMGCLSLPGGGLTSAARLRSIIEHQATVLCCTPTYALRLAEVAKEEGIDLRNSPVRRLMVAGEPGGSLPATRAQLEAAWPGARVSDHHGMTEVGPVTFECPECPGVLHIMEDAFFAEIVDPQTGRAVLPGETGELILTTLGRAGSPLLRYRTGDRVQLAADERCVCGRSDLALTGGILGRVDDMIVIRGVNVYPAAVEEIIRQCGGIAEYRVQVRHDTALSEISVEVEPETTSLPAAGLAARLEELFQTTLTLRVPVTLVPPGSLPRFETKARRWQKTEAR